MTALGSDLYGRRARALSAVESTCDIVLCLDEQGVVTYAGAATLDRLEVDADDLIGATPETWLLPINAADLYAHLAEVTDTRAASARRSLRLWCRCGETWRACAVTLTDMRDDDDVAAVVLSGIDDTSAAGDIGPGSQFLDLLAVGVLSLDEKGTVCFANAPAAALLGAADTADLVGARPFDQAVRVLARADRGGDTPDHFNIESVLPDGDGELSDLTQLRLVLADGSTIWAESRWQRSGGRTHVWIREAAEVFPAPVDSDEHHAHISALLGGVGDYVAVVDGRGKVAWASPSARAAAARLGIELDDQVFTLLHPDDLDEPSRLVQSARDGHAGAPEVAQLRMRHPDGGWQLVEVTVTNHLDDPTLSGFLVHARDVTDVSVSREIRRGTQQALMRGLAQADPQPALEAVCVSLEKLLRSQFPTAAVSVVHLEVDNDGQDTVRAAIGHHTGLRPFQSPLQLSVDQLLELATTPDQGAPAGAPGSGLADGSREEVADGAAVAVSPGGLRIRYGPLADLSAAPFDRAWSVPLIGPSGLAKGVLLILLRDDRRAPDALAMRALDRFAPLTALLIARHRQQARTTESEARFRSVFHDTKVPSALVSNDGRFVEVNNALTTMIGVPAEDLVGAAVVDLEVEPGPDRRGCHQWRTSSGHELWIQRTAADVRGPDGKVRYRVEHYVDVTAQRTTEDEVRLLNDMLCVRITELDAAKDRLAGAFRKITQVREDERRTLAVHLHDDPVQQLIGARWLLDEVDPDGANDDVRAASAALDGAVNSIRAIITDLRPPSLDVVGLPDALEQRALKVLGDATLVEVVDELNDKVPEDLSTLIFRTAGEALSNIRKHAGADHVLIALGNVGECVVVKIADNGRGFDPAAAFERARAGHLGVTSMREQILLAGGQFHIGARSDGEPGTEVSFSLPRLAADTVVSGWPD